MKTDEDIALEIIAGCSNLFDIEHRVVPRLIVALTTVRKEAREAGFRDALQIVSAMPVNNNVQNFTRASAFKTAAITALTQAATRESNNESAVED